MREIKFFSLRLPFGRYRHYANGRKIGESRPAFQKGLVHYGRRRKLIGKMERSFFGEPIYYDPERHCIGFSRDGSFGKMVHYDKNGSVVGYTWNLFHLIYFHRVSEGSALGTVFFGHRR